MYKKEIEERDEKELLKQYQRNVHNNIILLISA